MDQRTVAYQQLSDADRKGFVRTTLDLSPARCQIRNTSTMAPLLASGRDERNRQGVYFMLCPPRLFRIMSRNIDYRDKASGHFVKQREVRELCEIVTIP